MTTRDVSVTAETFMQPGRYTVKVTQISNLSFPQGANVKPAYMNPFKENENFSIGKIVKKLTQSL